MSEIIEFPLPDRPFTRSEIDALHSQAFRDLEDGICNCVNMCRIAIDQVFGTLSHVEHDKELFAMCHLDEMLKKLKADYYAAWHGELAAKQDRA